MSTSRLRIERVREDGSHAVQFTDFDTARQRHVRAALVRLPAEVEKLSWPLERLHALRDERLQDLVRTAKARSPWHARRLKHVDPDRLRGDDLSAIPPMTKGDLMANWDEIVTDRRITLDLANDHLRRIEATGLEYLLDSYMVIATGGSSGTRGVFVWDFEGWLTTYLAFARNFAWLRQRSPDVPEPRTAQVMAEAPIHGTVAFGLTFAGLLGPTARFPVTLPLAEIVAGLNAFQPSTLSSYAAMLHRLALEARAGRLRIAPRLVGCGGEPLLPQAQREIGEAFGVPVVDVYAASEGVWMAMTFPGSTGSHLAEDNAVYEPVDTEGRPVPPGRPAAKLLLTNVVNHILPLIRYELADEMTFLEGPDPDPWTGRRIASIRGRVDDPFSYADGVLVHPHVLDSALTAIPEVREYQIRQTMDGADVLVEADGGIHLEPLREGILRALRRAGLPAPTVTVHVVDAIDRVAGTGKVKRFVPLAMGR